MQGFSEDTDDGYYTTEIADIPLYDGAYIEIQGDIHLNFISENAQISTMHGMDNPMDLSAVATLSPAGNSYLAGEDIPAGVYDIRAVDGWTSVWVNYTDEEAGGGVMIITIGWNQILYKKVIKTYF